MATVILGRAISGIGGAGTMAMGSIIITGRLAAYQVERTVTELRQILFPVEMSPIGGRTLTSR